MYVIAIIDIKPTEKKEIYTHSFLLHLINIHVFFCSKPGLVSRDLIQPSDWSN